MSKTTEERVDILRSLLKSHNNFPKPGIMFWDIFSILRNPAASRDLIDLMVEHIQNTIGPVDAVGGMDSRGFLFAPQIAHKLNVPFFPLRKPGKLPGELASETYSLEYGKDSVEIQVDSIKKGDRVVLVDDLIATGGTLSAGSKLIQRLGGSVAECLVVMELTELKGRNNVDVQVFSLIKL